MRRWLSRLRNERGNVLMFTIGTIVALIAFGGLAMDIGRAVATKAELQKAFDAGTLAGAAQLGLDSSTYNTAGSQGASWANRNGWTGGSTSVSWDTGNNGNVTLGVWNPGTKSWTKSLGPVTGIPVNAVNCQWTASVPTAFLSLVGMSSINVTARSMAWRGAPANPCPGCPVFPMGVPRCAFPDFSTAGCGSLIVYTPNGNNGAGWVNLLGGGANSSDIRPQLAGVTATSSMVASASINATDGSLGGSFNDLSSYNPGSGRSSGYFYDQFTNGPIVTVKDGTNTTTTYSGHGWEILAPVINAPCSGPLPSPVTIVTWTYIVLVQVINGGYCTVDNGNGPWSPNCKSGVNNGTGPSSSNGNYVYGYYSCKLVNSDSLGTAAPLTAFATRPRLGL